MRVAKRGGNAHHQWGDLSLPITSITGRICSSSSNRTRSCADIARDGPSKPISQSSATFLKTHAKDIWASDFLPVIDIWFRPLSLSHGGVSFAADCSFWCDAVTDGWLGRSATLAPHAPLGPAGSGGTSASTARSHSVRVSAALFDLGSGQQVWGHLRTNRRRHSHRGFEDALSRAPSECTL